MLVLLIGVLSIQPVLAGPSSYVRKVAIATETLPLSDDTPGGAYFTREEIDKMNAIVTSERVCRLSLIECRKNRVKTVVSGLATWEVVLITVGVGIATMAVGVVVGKYAF